MHALLTVVGLATSSAAAAPPPPVDPDTGGALAVTVAGPLVHTAQFLPPVPRESPAAQVEGVFDAVAASVRSAGGDPGRWAKLNLVLADPGVLPVVRAAIVRRFPASPPAVCVAVAPLPRPGAVVAADAVAPAGRGPVGRRVYVSGQAETAADPAEAARKTLASLRATLRWLDLGDDAVIQVKVFVRPVEATDAVARELAAHFGPGKVPPAVFVTWDSAGPPVEIELIASAPPPRPGETVEPVEYLTPPGMTASPVYARVTRVAADRVVYTAGLHAPGPGSGDDQVAAAFAAAGELLKRSGTDFRHLAKATYYVTDDAAGKALNVLRPRYYDPRRPPAASKAKVAGTGLPGRTLTFDLIAVPPR